MVRKCDCLSFILNPVVEHARMGSDVVRWQGETTKWVRAREEEQRRQRAVALLSQVCSAHTQRVKALVAENSMLMRCCKRCQAVNCRI